YRKILKSNPNCLSEDFYDQNIPEKDMFLYWSPKTADFYEVQSIVEFLRRKYPQAIHVAGGTHIDYNQEECVKVFDAIIVGPGERTMLQIIDNHIGGYLKQVYQDEWKHVHYKDFTFARRDFLPRETIVTDLFEKYGHPDSTCVLFSRGCPYRCSFCVYNTPNTLQVRQDVEAEINYLKNEYGISAINLKDEVCIGHSVKIYTPFLESVGNCGIMWRGQTIVGVPESLLDLAKESGCVELVLGVESVVQNVLDSINKRQTVKQCEETIEYLSKIGIKSRANIIFGLPNEPEDIVDKTIEFIERNKLDYVSVSGLCPVPGSDMYANPSKYGIRVIDKNWDRHAHLMFRYGDDEDHGLPFHFEKGFKQEEIINNMEGFSWKHQKFNALSVPEYSAGFTWIKNADNQEILNGPFPKY
ncbi:hypothetical protein LCGC14_2784360, partial [marine sediment metagenome]